jgi:hypothetical protein
VRRARARVLPLPPRCGACSGALSFLSLNVVGGGSTCARRTVKAIQRCWKKHTRMATQRRQRLARAFMLCVDPATENSSRQVSRTRAACLRFEGSRYGTLLPLICTENPMREARGPAGRAVSIIISSSKPPKNGRQILGWGRWHVWQVWRVQGAAYGRMKRRAYQFWRLHDSRVRTRGRGTTHASFCLALAPLDLCLTQVCTRRSTGL